MLRISLFYLFFLKNNYIFSKEILNSLNSHEIDKNFDALKVNENLYEDIEYIQNNVGNFELSEYIFSQLKKYFILNKNVNIPNKKLKVFEEYISRVSNIQIELLECTITFKKAKKKYQEHKIIFTSENEKQLFIELLTKHNIPYYYKDIHNSYKDYIKDVFSNIGTFGFLAQFIFSYIYKDSLNKKEININQHNELNEVQNFIIKFLQNEKKEYEKLKNKINFNEKQLEFLEKKVEINSKKKLLKKYNKNEDIENLTLMDRKHLFNLIGKNINKKVLEDYIKFYCKNIININAYVELLSEKSEEKFKDSIIKEEDALKRFSAIYAGEGGTGKTTLAKKYAEINMCRELIKYARDDNPEKQLPDFKFLLYVGSDFSAIKYIGTGVSVFNSIKAEIFEYLQKGYKLVLIIDEADNFVGNHIEGNPDKEASTLMLSLLTDERIQNHYRDSFTVIFTTNVPPYKTGETTPEGRRNFCIPVAPIPTIENIEKLIFNFLSNMYYEIYYEKDIMSDNKKKIYLGLKTFFQNNKVVLKELINFIYKKHQERFINKKLELIKNKTIILNEEELKKFMEIYNNKNYESVKYTKEDILEMEKYLFGALSINGILQSLNNFLSFMIDFLLKGNRKKDKTNEIALSISKTNNKNIIQKNILNNEKNLLKFIEENLDKLKNEFDYFLSR
jgi:hypothetical protein